LALARSKNSSASFSRRSYISSTMARRSSSLTLSLAERSPLVLSTNSLISGSSVKLLEILISIIAIILLLIITSIIVAFKRLVNQYSLLVVLGPIFRRLFFAGVIPSAAAFQAERGIWRRVQRRCTRDPSASLVKARALGMTQQTHPPPVFSVRQRPASSATSANPLRSLRVYSFALEGRTPVIPYPDIGARMSAMPKRRSAIPARIPRPKSVSKAQPPADRPHAPGYGIVGPRDGKGLLPWSFVERKMSRCRTFWLATIYPAAIDPPAVTGSPQPGSPQPGSSQSASPHPNSTPATPRPHVMPLWGVWVDDAFYFSTGRTSRKGQNLAANPACTVTNDDGMEAIIVEGQAKEVKAPAELEKMAAAYKKKYKMDPRGMNEPIFKLAPAKVFAFIEKSFPKSATRWKL